ncbi:MAG: peptidoglycan DD-metalloendopeptidase family protein [Rikenellaceae bacterium]|nr:peptidoglycan DD-metalloendopeptidase family protein [Rikenellaceae bacterium]
MTIGVSGQSLEELRAQMSRDQEELKATNALLGVNQNKISTSERDRRLTENKIAAQRKIIANYEKQASIIGGEITANSRQIRELDSHLAALKKDYGAVVYSAWKNHKMNNAVAFLFASRDFNDATRRVAHMKRYNRMREQRAAEIDSVSFVLQYEIDQLATRKQELDDAKAQQKAETNELSKSEKQLSKIISGLRGDRKKLEAKAKAQKASIAKAQKQIDKIIAEQARAAQRGRSEAQREQDVVLSGKFEENKGLLPWPVTGGSVLHRFGKQKVSDNITTDFKGIEIAAPAGAAVRAVFEGEVTGVYNMDHFNTCVTVRSGSYIVLYANLVAASIKTGEKVAINQRLGALSNNADTDGQMLVFQIWRETTPVDPLTWLRK